MNYYVIILTKEIKDHINFNFVTTHVFDDARKSQTEREPGCLMCLRVISVADEKSRNQG